MALDTVGKRGSVIGLSSPWRPWLAVPSGGFDALDRLSLEYYAAAVTPGEFVEPVTPPKQTGAGKSRKTRKRRYQVEVDGQVFAVSSVEEAEEVLEKVRKEAEEAAAVAIERASKAKRRPVRKVIADAKKALQLPKIAVSSPDLAAYANQILGAIRADYESAIHAIEIAALMARRDREIDEDDEEVMLLL